MSILGRPSTDLLVVDSLAEELVRPQHADLTPASPPPSVEAIKARLLEWEAKYAAGKAQATLKAVRADWQVFLRWCDRSGTWALPVASADLLRFLQDQVILGKKATTLTRYVNTIRLIHSAARLPDPTGYDDWKLDWAAICADLKALDNFAPQQAEPMRTTHVERILASLGTSPLDLRDAALISLASDTLCRESELTKLTIEDFTRSSEAWVVDVRWSKTDKDGMGTTRYCSPETKARIDAWCACAGISSGLLFIPIGPKGRLPHPLPDDRKPLRPSEVAKIIRRRAIGAGIAEGARMTGHSGRVGSAIELLEAGYSVTDVQYAGGWDTTRMVLHYGKRALAGRNAMSKLRKRQARGDA